MSKTLLYEIGVEEMPSRFVEYTMNQLKTTLKKELDDARVSFGDIRTFATPRRVILVVEEISERQEDFEEEVKGPSKKIALTDDGEFSKAALGFMRGKEIEKDQVYFKNLDGVEYLFATIKEEGKKSVEVLPEILERIVKSVVYPKSMRWGGKNMRFVRPIRWILALIDDEVLTVDLEGIISSNITVGHRFLGEKKIEVKNIDDYFKKLRDNYVIYDQNERKKIILEQINKVAESLGGKIDMDEELLDEVVYIVEYPTAFFGRFNEEYLKLPKEVVKTPMKAHQRYFPVVDEDKNLLPYFVAVRNGSDYKIENVQKGNEKVLESRLADALFFYKEDVSKNLEFFRNKLDTVVFQEKLGTLFEKSDRIYKFAQSYDFGDYVDREILKKAAYYAKADLVTNMVFEFDELQGYMGMEYSKLEGLDAISSKAIFEQYLPRFSGDILPETNEGAMLSIIDKMDTIVGFFSVGIQPTGSADPFALRRQSLGVLSILLDKRFDLDLANLSKSILLGYENIDCNVDKVVGDVVEFFEDRIKVMFKDKGIRYDVIDAVLSIEEKNIFDLYNRAEAINRWIDRESLTDMLTAFNRVSTLAEKSDSIDIDVDLFKEESERNLYAEFLRVDSDIKKLMEDKNYTSSLDRFASLKTSIDTFFDSVMVMDDDDDIRKNRLAILKNIYASMLNICDLSKIVYK